MTQDNASMPTNNHTVCVSVIILTYNHKNFIAQAIEGALQQQTNFPYEIIIGEDESQDGTREICVEYAEKYPDLIRLFLRSRKDVIYVDNRATGRFNLIQSLRAARGKYIAMCEGDDYWTDPHKLQKQVDFLEANPDYVLCHHDAVIINSDGQVIQGSMTLNHQKHNLSKSSVVKYPRFVTASVCYRNILPNMPPEFLNAPGGDTFLFSLLGLYGKAKYMGDVIEPSRYRRHQGGVWSSLKASEAFMRSATTRYWLGQYYIRLGEKDFARHHIAYHHLKLGLAHYHQRNTAQAREKMFLALKELPRCWEIWWVFLSYEIFPLKLRERLASFKKALIKP